MVLLPECTIAFSAYWPGSSEACTRRETSMAIGTMAAKLGGRLALLIPMAACAMLLLESQDRTVRVLAFVAIIVLEQIRQFLLLLDV